MAKWTFFFVLTQQKAKRKLQPEDECHYWFIVFLAFAIAFECAFAFAFAQGKSMKINFDEKLLSLAFLTEQR